MLRKSFATFIYERTCATNMSAVARDFPWQSPGDAFSCIVGGGCSFFLDGDLARRVIAEVELELCLRTVIACVDDDGLKKLGQHSVLSPTCALDSIFA